MIDVLNLFWDENKKEFVSVFNSYMLHKYNISEKEFNDKFDHDLVNKLEKHIVDILKINKFKVEGE